MIQVGVLSRDVMLVPVLSSVLTPEFMVFQEPDPGLSNAQHPANRIDVLILDLDSSSCSPEEWKGLYDNIKSHFSTPVIIMANDESRSHALDLVERGAHGYRAEASSRKRAQSPAPECA